MRTITIVLTGSFVGVNVSPPPGVNAVKDMSAMPTNSQHQTSGRTRRSTAMGSLLMFLSLAATGCQMDIAGQTLPSPYYQSDDVQYYAPGPEFKLSREAAALKEQSANQISEPQQ
jgi:hypothetical protein